MCCDAPQVTRGAVSSDPDTFCRAGEIHMHPTVSICRVGVVAVEVDGGWGAPASLSKEL